jgi:hypothetical protein
MYLGDNFPFTQNLRNLRWGIPWGRRSLLPWMLDLSSRCRHIFHFMIGQSLGSPGPPWLGLQPLGWSRVQWLAFRRLGSTIMYSCTIYHKGPQMSTSSGWPNSYYYRRTLRMASCYPSLFHIVWLSGTIIRGTLKTPNSQLVTPISIKLQRPDGYD